MPTFVPGLAKTASLKLTVPSELTDCEVRAAFTKDGVIVKGPFSATFTPTGVEQLIPIELITPSSNGTYTLTIKVVVGGTVVGDFYALEPVIIATTPTSTNTEILSVDLSAASINTGQSLVATISWYNALWTSANKVLVSLWFRRNSTNLNSSFDGSVPYEWGVTKVLSTTEIPAIGAQATTQLIIPIESLIVKLVGSSALMTSLDTWDIKVTVGINKNNITPSFKKTVSGCGIYPIHAHVVSAYDFGTTCASAEISSAVQITSPYPPTFTPIISYSWDGEPFRPITDVHAYTFKKGSVHNLAVKLDHTALSCYMNVVYATLVGYDCAAGAPNPATTGKYAFWGTTSAMFVMWPEMATMNSYDFDIAVNPNPGDIVEPVLGTYPSYMILKCRASGQLSGTYTTYMVKFCTITTN